MTQTKLSDENLRKWCDYVLASPPCSYCGVSLTHDVRIECEVCVPRFVLCSMCHSVGVELDNHTNNHRYRVRDAAVLDLFNTSWSFADEYAFLESMLQNGLGNWAKAAADTAKAPHQCREHYNYVFLNHPLAPFPNVSLLRSDNMQGPTGSPQTHPPAPCCPFHADPRHVATSEAYMAAGRAAADENRFTHFNGTRLDFGGIAPPDRAAHSGNFDWWAVEATTPHYGNLMWPDPIGDLDLTDPGDAELDAQLKGLLLGIDGRRMAERVRRRILATRVGAFNFTDLRRFERERSAHPALRDYVRVMRPIARFLQPMPRAFPWITRVQHHVALRAALADVVAVIASAALRGQLADVAIVDVLPRTAAAATAVGDTCEERTRSGDDAAALSPYGYVRARDPVGAPSVAAAAATPAVVDKARTPAGALAAIAAAPTVTPPVRLSEFLVSSLHAQWCPRRDVLCHVDVTGGGDAPPRLPPPTVVATAPTTHAMSLDDDGSPVTPPQMHVDDAPAYLPAPHAEPPLRWTPATAATAISRYAQSIVTAAAAADAAAAAQRAAAATGATAPPSAVGAFSAASEASMACRRDVARLLADVAGQRRRLYPDPHDAFDGTASCAVWYLAQGTRAGSLPAAPPASGCSWRDLLKARCDVHEAAVELDNARSRSANHNILRGSGMGGAGGARSRAGGAGGAVGGVDARTDRRLVGVREATAVAKSGVPPAFFAVIRSAAVLAFHHAPPPSPGGAGAVGGEANALVHEPFAIGYLDAYGVARVARTLVDACTQLGLQPRMASGPLPQRVWIYKSPMTIVSYRYGVDLMDFHCDWTVSLIPILCTNLTSDLLGTIQDTGYLSTVPLPDVLAVRTAIGLFAPAPVAQRSGPANRRRTRS